MHIQAPILALLTRPHGTCSASSSKQIVNNTWFKFKYLHSLNWIKQHGLMLIFRWLEAASSCFEAETGHLGAGGRGAGTLRLNVSPLEECREGALPHTNDGSASFISIARL